MNGYKNAETYFCSLWLDADAMTRREFIALAKATEDDDPDEVLKNVADAMRRFVENGAPVLSGSLYGDLLDAAIESIDFRQIAAEYIEEART